MAKHLKSSAWETEMPNFLSICPLDGRNYHKVALLADYFSELALNKMRLYVEITYLIHLGKIGVAPRLTINEHKKLFKIHEKFDESAMKKVRKIEHTTNHDVKAVEYYLKNQLKQIGLTKHEEFVHWALASEDVNNLAYSLLLRDYHQTVLLSLIDQSLDRLADLASNSDYPMLGRTHGQPASVTTMGKELAVYLERLSYNLKQLRGMKFYGKLSGATGAYTDQLALDSSKNWPKLNADYIDSLGLKPVKLTTQILPYEYLADYFSRLKMLQETAVDLCQNLWWYVSFDYFIQQKIKNETGSSIMPQKINPIYLEGGEGGFQISNSLLGFYAEKFLHSRLQRDLSDATVRRSFGIALAYSYLSWQSLTEALERLSPHAEGMQTDLDNHWEIMAAPIQNYLRTKGYKQPYELLKDKTRGLRLTKAQMQELMKDLPIKKEDLAHLRTLTPGKLAKTASKLAKKTISSYQKKSK
jgi:adenylosuccinate lyase